MTTRGPEPRFAITGLTIDDMITVQQWMVCGAAWPPPTQVLRRRIAVATASALHEYRAWRRAHFKCAQGGPR